jgi:hypothetical protein
MYCYWYVMYRHSSFSPYCSIVYFYLYIVSSVALLSSSVCRAFAPVPKRPFQVALGVPPFTLTYRRHGKKQRCTLLLTVDQLLVQLIQPLHINGVKSFFAEGKTWVLHWVRVRDKGNITASGAWRHRQSCTNLAREASLVKA